MPARTSHLHKLAAGVMGACLALWIVKLGTPVILDYQVESPHNWLEAVFSSWPINWGYVLLAVACVAGLFVWRWETAPFKHWINWLPLAWLGWQLISSIQSVRPDLTVPTLIHFVACVACFYLGLFALSRMGEMKFFWLGCVVALLVVIWAGFRQHYGGLEQTRQAFAEMKVLAGKYDQFLTTHQGQSPEQMQREWDTFRKSVGQPDLTPGEMQQIYDQLKKLDTPEFQKKISSNRIFSTFVYPNALAGCLLLFLPLSLAALWQLTSPLSGILRKVLVGLLAYGGIACLYWSQSKAGWLIALSLVFLLFLNLPIAKKFKWIGCALVLMSGLAAFGLKYSGYFAKGATSVVARTDYWRAAWQLAWERPVLGSGPGTFMAGYSRLKKPESEMARLAHNDYLQQASDSGWPGFLLYTGFIWASILTLYRRIAPNMKTSPQGKPGKWLRFTVWLGVTGLALQSLVEFGLYIPALAWPFFLLLGWLWGVTRHPMTNEQ